MKKLITFFVFALVMGLGVQNSFGQQLTQKEDRPEVIAKKKVQELSETLNLSDDQQRTLFRAFVASEVSYKKNVSGKDLNDPAVMAAKKEADATLESAMKKTLSEDQYAAYKAGKKN